MHFSVIGSIDITRGYKIQFNLSKKNHRTDVKRLSENPFTPGKGTRKKIYRWLATVIEYFFFIYNASAKIWSRDSSLEGQSV